MADQPAIYEPEATYRVEVARVVRFDGLVLRGDITMTGEAVGRLVAIEGQDVILSADKVDGGA